MIIVVYLLINHPYFRSGLAAFVMLMPLKHNLSLVIIIFAMIFCIGSLSYLYQSMIIENYTLDNRLFILDNIFYLISSVLYLI